MGKSSLLVENDECCDYKESEVYPELTPLVECDNKSNKNKLLSKQPTNEILKPMSESDKLSELMRAIDDKGFNKAIKYMMERVRAEEQIIEIKYELNCFSDEGALALFQAVKNVTGTCDLTATEEMSGDNVPELIDVCLPNDERVKIPWGRVALPSFDKESYLDMEYSDCDVQLIVTGTIKMKFEPEVKLIIDEAKRILNEESIYKGQAVSLEFDNDGDAEEPEFINFNNIHEDKILLSSIAKEGLMPIMARIEHTQRCVDEGLDLKYGALMEGTYGTGKTLLAFMIGKIATLNGWTFIYLKDCTHLAQTLKIAENYTKTMKGVVVFSEDIDQTLRGDRNKHMQDILNTIDGGDTKQTSIISIFTTNHIELIEPTFMRGKRIGGLISLGPLDEETAPQFINKFVVNDKGDCLMDDTSEIESAAKCLIGVVPAFASEIIDKAKAFMISRNGERISTKDIESAANSYKRQMAHATLKKTDKEDGQLIKALNYLMNCTLKGVKTGPFNLSDETKPI